MVCGAPIKRRTSRIHRSPTHISQGVSVRRPDLSSMTIHRAGWSGSGEGARVVYGPLMRVELVSSQVSLPTRNPIAQVSRDQWRAKLQNSCHESRACGRTHRVSGGEVAAAQL